MGFIDFLIGFPRMCVENPRHLFMILIIVLTGSFLYIIGFYD